MTTRKRFSISFITHGAALWAALALMACAQTQVTSTTRDPNYDFQAKRSILVIALVKKPANQRLLEDEFVKLLQKRGSEAVPSYTLVPDGTKLDEAGWKKMVADRHFETVIVSRLISMDVVEKDVDPKFVERDGGNAYGYYNTGYSVVYQPAFTLRKETAAVETRVFDAAAAKLVWSGASKTNIEEGRDPAAQIHDFVHLMMKKIYG